MNLEGNTVLITGGSSGIGLELARGFLRRRNTVIVTGRNRSALEAAQKTLPGLQTIQSDVADPDAIADLHRRIARDFPRLNVLVNNAGVMRKIDLQTSGDDARDITEEIEINLSGPIRMVTRFLPVLKTQATAAIINLSSGLAFIPHPLAPVYSATKAAIHSFTQSLRVQLANTRIKVFELVPPPVDTTLLHPFAEKGAGGPRPISAAKLAAAALTGIGKERLEIRVGFAKVTSLMSRVAPAFALARLSKATGAT